MRWWRRLITGVIGLIVSGLARRDARRANEIAAAANRISEEANGLSKEANERDERDALPDEVLPRPRDGRHL